MIKKSVVLACDADRAFTLFTREMSVWWPEDRRHTKDPESSIQLSPAGRFWERARDGREVELGRVRVFEPPGLLVLDWYVGTDAEHPTEVTVRFEAEAEGTRVAIEHRPTAASAEVWTGRADLFGRSWDAVLAAIAEAARGGL
jgi:uncharacterized protein YndB with AHSA1/START domain